MPENFLYKIFRKIVLCVSLLGAFFPLACQNSAEKDSAALKNDKQTFAQLSQIGNIINTTRSVSAENFTALKAIREKYPNAPEVRQVYQSALIIREDWETLEIFLKEKPSAEMNVDERKELAKVLLNLGKYADVIETLKPLAETNPHNTEIRGLLGSAYFFLNQLDEAAMQLDGVWDKIIAEKKIDEMTMRGLIYLRQNNPAKAIETLQKAIAINPSNIPANNALSQAFARQGNVEQAEIYRQKTAELQDKMQSNELEGRQKVQDIYAIETAWNDKKYQEVIKLAEEMLKKVSDNNQKAVLYEYLYKSHQALGNQAEAKKIMTEAQNELNKNPNLQQK
jgi:tetratricopeptide (TPR) repeat protein